MAAPLTADRLVRALKDEGVKVVEYGAWRTHNRNHVGAWGPVHGVMIHHTVTTGTNGSVSLCYKGRSDLPGPLCHGVIAKDGTVYLVGNGRANHAGGGDRRVLDAVIAERALPAPKNASTDGNPHFYGFECVNMGDGRDPWPAAQVEAIVRASAALCRAHGWGKDGETSVIGHLEWQPGKIDPRGPGITMRDVRRRVAERLEHQPGWDPENEEDELTSEQMRKLADMVADEVVKRLPAKVWSQPVEHGDSGPKKAATWLVTGHANAVAAKVAAQAVRAELAPGQPDSEQQAEGGTGGERAAAGQ